MQVNQVNKLNWHEASFGKKTRDPSEGGEEGGKTRKVPEEREETRKGIISENEGNTPYLSGEEIMESVGSIE